MRNYIEEDAEDAMPVVCDCGNIFDLNEGHSSNYSNVMICEECSAREEEELEREDKIEELKNTISDAQITILDAESEIKYAREEIEEAEKTLKALLEKQKEDRI